MKSRHLFATAALVGAVSIPAIAAAQQLAAQATTDLNMRAGPGPQYEVTGTINANAPVTILGCTEARSWCQVEWQGQTGWAFAQYLQLPQQQVIVSEAQQVEIPQATFDADTTAGAATGAVAGAIAGGPVGAIIGGVAGAALGSAIDPDDRVVTYVREQDVEPVFLEGEVVVGARLPETVTLHEIPESDLRFAVVNRQPVLVQPAERQIVYIVR